MIKTTSTGRDIVPSGMPLTHSFFTSSHTVLCSNILIINYRMGSSRWINEETKRTNAHKI